MSRAEVYRNLHKDCYSVRKKGKVIAYETRLFLLDATFAVQPAGRQKVLDQKRKNVHAFVRGNFKIYPEDLTVPLETSKLVSYNPYKFGYFYFVETGLPIYEAPLAYFNDKGVYVWTQNDFNPFLTGT